MRSILGVILVAFTVAFCSAAQASPCDTDQNRVYSNWKVNTLQRNADKELLENYLSEASLAEFVAAYNETPPKSHKDPANVAVWATKAAMLDHLSGKTQGNAIPVSLVVFIDDSGCIIETETIPLFVMEKLMQGVPYIAMGRGA